MYRGSDTVVVGLDLTRSRDEDEGDNPVAAEEKRRREQERSSWYAPPRRIDKYCQCFASYPRAGQINIDLMAKLSGVNVWASSRKCRRAETIGAV
jgi:hypothetical protein